MECEKIEEILKTAIRKVMPRAPELTPDLRFREDLGADSLDMTSLIMEIEDEFHIRVDDDSVRLVSSIKDTIALIAQALEPVSHPGSADVATATPGITTV